MSALGPTKTHSDKIRPHASRQIEGSRQKGVAGRCRGCRASPAGVVHEGEGRATVAGKVKPSDGAVVDG